MAANVPFQMAPRLTGSNVEAAREEYTSRSLPHCEQNRQNSAQTGMLTEGPLGELYCTEINNFH